MRICGVVSAAAAIAAAAAAVLAGEPKPAAAELPLWPYPQQVKVEGGSCDLGGKPVYVPAAAGEKTLAVAGALARRFGPAGSASAVKREGTAPAGFAVLSVGVSPAAWAQAAQKCLLGEAHPNVKDQGYFLAVSPEGAVIASPSARGLSYGALTLMQLARGAGKRGAGAPCVTVLDWPDMEIRAAMAGCPTYPMEHRRLAGQLCWEGKLNQICWYTQGRSYAFASHPEGGHPSRKQEDMAKVVDEVRRWGVEVFPCHGMNVNPHSGNLPYAFLGDNETFFWAMTDMVDEDLEIFRPRYFGLSMGEEHWVRKHMFYSGRTFEQWRDAAVRFMKHLRRRGVMGTIETEALFPTWAGSKMYPWTFGKKYPDGYFEFTATFPNDLEFTPWFYWTKSTEDALTKCDIERQAKTGLPVLPIAMGVNVQHHVAAVKMLMKDYPNLLGVTGSVWGGEATIPDRGDCPRHPFYIETSIGPLWHLGSPERAAGFAWEKEPGISDWECLLDAEPPASVPEALGKLQEEAWRVWTGAREQLVSAGLPAAPALLAAMSKETGERRDRIEGCLSRMARDARHGWKRGALDAGAATRFLQGGAEEVKDMAAELIASCTDGGTVALRQQLKDPAAAASCVRALGIVKDRTCAKDLVEVLGNAGSPARARAEAARVLGLFGTKDASKPLLEALRSAKAPELRKAALWALALVGCKEAEGDLVPLLESEDTDLRYRAAVALTLLKSPEVKRLTAWLSKDRHSLELAAWALPRCLGGAEAKRAMQDAMKTQTDENSRQRLKQLIEEIEGKAKK